jgi:uncharacterized repeat protein (TIGR01451 family)
VFCLGQAHLREEDGLLFFGVIMNFKKIYLGFTKSSQVRRKSTSRARFSLCFIISLCLLPISTPALSAPICASPGNDGSANLSGIINTYYPGTTSVSAGALSIPVGSAYGNTSSLIADGDMLLVMQMQDADINYGNNSNYGSGSGTGSGYTNPNRSGAYEYVIAAGPVSGGYVPISTPLVNSFRDRSASRTNGQSSYQVIRVPQYSLATVVGTVSPLPWNGSVGGVVAVDVAGNLTVNGAISVNGAGFRGGWGESSSTTGPDTDYRTRATVLGNGMKGEGIAGSPNRMNQPTTFNGAPNQVTSGSLGYPNGTNADASKGRGAPGNAGGGGTDGATDNSENSGGGGGGNYAAGAKGGNSWNSNLTVGGEGGGAVTGLAFNRVVMGGGGGAGTSNNSTSDTITYTNPPGISCNSTNGACSSGAPGGGIILIRANSISGSGTITANGGSGYNVGNDSAGGGGAGGSIVIDTQAGGTATVSANGGDGGNAWRSQAAGTYPGERHGPGGAGSGGFIAYSPASGLAISASVNPGTSGKTTTSADLYGSTSSAGGIYTFLSPNTPGSLPGYACSPLLSVVKSANADTFNPGQVITYSVLVTNSGTGGATSVIAQDQISPYVYWGVNSYGANNSFQISNGTPTSNLNFNLCSKTYYDGSSWSYSPQSEGGGAPIGFDANVKAWKIDCSNAGAMNGNGANFTISYRVMVK